MANLGGNTNPYIKVYVNGELLRKFGGTRSKVPNYKIVGLAAKKHIVL